MKILISGLNECGCNISGVCIQETWLSDIDDISLFHLEGYTLISQNKVSSKHGGVAIYLSESYDYKLLPLYPNTNIWDGQFIEIQTPSAHKNIIVGNIYRPPQDININYDTFIRELQPIIQELNKRKCEVILSGDYNIDLLKINEKPKFNEFLDTLCSYNFLPKITLPTRLGVTSATLIDNFKPVYGMLTSPIYIITSQISDHLPYLMILNAIKSKTCPPKYIQINNMKMNTIIAYKEKISDANIYDKLDTNIMSDPNKNRKIIIKTLTDIKAETMPSKTVKLQKHKHKTSKWITGGIIRSITYRDKLYSTLKKTPTSSEEYCRLKTNLLTYNNILKHNIKQAKQLYYRDFCITYKNNNKKTWNGIKEVMGKYHKAENYPELFKYNNKLLKNKQDIVNNFNDFFINLASTLASKIKKPSHKSFKNYMNKKHESI